MSAPLPRWAISIPALVCVVLLVVALAADLTPGVRLALIGVQLLCVAQAFALWRHDRQSASPSTGPYSGVPAK